MTYKTTSRARVKKLLKGDAAILTLAVRRRHREKCPLMNIDIDSGDGHPVTLTFNHVCGEWDKKSGRLVGFTVGSITIKPEPEQAK